MASAEGESSPKLAATLVGTFVAALSFFTRIPRPPWPQFRPEDEQYAAAFAPFVGLIVGGIAWATLVASSAFLTPLLAVIMTAAVTTWVTGALHEDGLADFCDGFGLPRSAEATLTIMRAPDTGVFGVLGLVFIVALKVTALLELVSTTSSVALCGYLLSVHALSRFVSVSFMSSLDYARIGDEKARGRRLSRRLPGRWFVLSAAGGVMPLCATAALLDWRITLLLLPVLTLQLFLRQWFQSRLNGYTGDCLGAAQQLCEVLLLLGLVVLTGGAI